MTGTESERQATAGQRKVASQPDAHTPQGSKPMRLKGCHEDGPELLTQQAFCTTGSTETPVTKHGLGDTALSVWFTVTPLLSERIWEHSPIVAHTRPTWLPVCFQRRRKGGFPPRGGKSAVNSLLSSLFTCDRAPVTDKHVRLLDSTVSSGF